MFELKFYQDRSIWKHKLKPNEVSKIDSDRVVDLIIYESHYVLLKKYVYFQVLIIVSLFEEDV